MYGRAALAFICVAFLIGAWVGWSSRYYLEHEDSPTEPAKMLETGIDSLETQQEEFGPVRIDTLRVVKYITKNVPYKVTERDTVYLVAIGSRTFEETFSFIANMGDGNRILEDSISVNVPVSCAVTAKTDSLGHIYLQGNLKAAIKDLKFKYTPKVVEKEKHSGLQLYGGGGVLVNQGGYFHPFLGASLMFNEKWMLNANAGESGRWFISGSARIF